MFLIRNLESFFIGLVFFEDLDFFYFLLELNDIFYDFLFFWFLLDLTFLFIDYFERDFGLSFITLHC
jgi:hypothetical protein